MEVKRGEEEAKAEGGEGGEYGTRKRKPLREKYGKIDMLSEGEHANKTGFGSCSLPYSVAPCSLCEKMQKRQKTLNEVLQYLRTSFKLDYLSLLISNNPYCSAK